MQGVTYVMERVRAGDRIIFGRDVYGQQFVELWRGWIFQRSSRIDLSPQEIRSIKNALLDLTAERRQAAA